jgi:multidrug efflux pump subunit AcrA (membrane-fusion protein)
MRRQRAYRSVLALRCLVVSCVLTGCASSQKAPEKPLVPVTVTEVKEYSGPEGVTYSASIVPYDQVNVAFKSGGYVTTILQRKGVDGRERNLQQGDWVKKGEVLARVRESDYQHAVEQYKGHLEEAQAAAEKSKQDFARAQALYDANALTQSDYDAAKAQNDSSQGAVVTAQATVAQAQQ